MKITVKQLKQLIREQVEEMAVHSGMPEAAAVDPYQKAVKMLNKEWGQGMARPFKFYAQLDQAKLMRLVKMLRTFQEESENEEIVSRLGLEGEEALYVQDMDLSDPPAGFPRELKAAGILVHAAEGSGEPQIIQRLAVRFAR